MNIKICGTGSALPEKVITNKDLEKMVETEDSWIVERTGISQRHMAAEDESAATLGAKAAQRALEMANMTIEDIDLILVATCSDDDYRQAHFKVDFELFHDVDNIETTETSVGTYKLTIHKKKEEIWEDIFKNYDDRKMYTMKIWYDIEDKFPEDMQLFYDKMEDYFNKKKEEEIKEKKRI